MEFSDQLKSIFVPESTIPIEFNLPQEIHQREYLCNGEMRQWNGDVSEVYSPVCIPDEQGNLARKFIGTYPVCTEKNQSSHHQQL